MLVGIGFNTLASLTAIALWVTSPRGRGAPASPGGPSGAVVSRSQPQDQPVQPPHRVSARFLPGTAPQPVDDGVDVVAPGSLARLPQRAGSGTAASASVIALGERLHLNPQVLTAQLGDEHGEISTLAADRLERGLKTGEVLAKRLGLDESQAQSLVALITYHVFSLLREEKQAAPGAVDLTRVDELTDTLLDDIRLTCGDPAAVAARSEVRGL